MVNFQGSHRPPPHQDRRLQLRMLGFVGLIAVLMFGWQAWRMTSGRGGPSKSDFPNPPPSLDQVDFGVEDNPSSPLKDDEIRIVRPRRRAVEDDVDQMAEEEFAAEESAVRIPPAWLADVHDNSVGIRQSEADVFYRILAKAQSIPLRDMQAVAEPDVLYVNLMTSPERYRGRLVTVRGELRKLDPIPKPQNDYGLKQLYEAWICTPDAGENPYRVVCSEIAPELKPGESSRIEVKVTGYFFKREGYQTHEGRLHVAPTLLARRLSLYVSPNAPPPVEHMVPWMVGVISVIGLAMLATVIGYAFSDSRARRRRMMQPVGAIEAEAMSRADQRISVEESLQRLAEGELIEDEPEDHALNGNGQSRLGDLADELVDLPTPFPPTRVPRRFDHPN